MTEYGFLSAFLVGIAGSLHCFGMCGGIAGALRLAIPNDQPSLLYICAYNIGRITSYAIAGALTGGLGLIAQAAATQILSIFQLLSALMLLAMGLYIAQWWRGLARLEQIGQRLWQLIRPLSQRFIPFKHPFSAFPYGFLWGWLPCGLVYSTLTWALLSGDPLQGALIMTAFGLGTLPALFAVAFSTSWIISILKSTYCRTFVACSLILYAIYLIYLNVNSIKYP